MVMIPTTTMAEAALKMLGSENVPRNGVTAVSAK